MDAGMAGGIAGGVIGVMGGVIGTYFSIRNSKRPKERALAIRLATLCWVWLSAMTAWLFLMPRPWNQAAILLNLPLLLSIPRMNRWLARARAEDESEA
jgi:uncharacterized membrane protein YfcA